MHGFLFINKRLLISCDTGIYPNHMSHRSSLISGQKHTKTLSLIPGIYQLQNPFHHLKTLDLIISLKININVTNINTISNYVALQYTSVQIQISIFRPLHKNMKTSHTQISCEPVREKTNNLGSDQVRHKPGCTVTEDG